MAAAAVSYTARIVRAQAWSVRALVFVRARPGVGPSSSPGSALAAARADRPALVEGARGDAAASRIRR